MSESQSRGRSRTRNAGRFALIAFVVTLGAGSLLTVGTAAAYAQAYEGRVMPGVTVADIPVGGLSPEAARTRLLDTLPDPTHGTLTLDVGGETLAVPYADISRHYELDAALDAAMAVGRTGNAVDRPADQLRSLMRGTTFPIRVSYDAAAVDARIAEFVAGIEREGRDASVRLRDTAGGGSTAWRVDPSEVAIDVDEAALVSAAHSALGGLATTTAPTQVSVPKRVTEPAITTAQADVAAARANAMSRQKLTLADGETTVEIPVETIRGWLDVEPATGGGIEVTVDAAAVRADLEALLEDVGVRAADAGFRFGAGLAIEAVAGRSGRELDLDATHANVMAALEARTAGTGSDGVDVVTTPTEPHFSTAQAEAAAPGVRMVSHWVTRFIPGVSNFRGRNIAVPASRIDGQVVAPGRWFDFWKAIGEVSRETGYGPGGAIINGRTEPTGALAGGICSCSTTIFNAALRAGLQMGQRRNHYYYIDRYPVGLDATVFKSSGGSVQSMRFRNDTDYPILIRAINRYGVVRFEIWTVPTGRSVSFSDPIIRNKHQARDTIEYTDDIPVGRSERIEYPADGFRAWVTRTVRDRDGNVIHKDTYYSRYATVDGVTLVGVRSDDPRNGRHVVVG